MFDWPMRMKTFTFFVWSAARASGRVSLCAGSASNLMASAGGSAGKVVFGFRPSSFCANETPPVARIQMVMMSFMVMVSYSTTTTGAPSTSIFGVMPRPGAVLADMKPFTRCGAPSAVETVT